jgi:hypothetical protein
MVQLLLAAGADVNAAGSDGQTPLHTAAQEGHFTVVQVLLTSGANPQLLNASHTTTLAVTAALCGHKGIVSLLLQACGQPQVTADDLMIAARIAVTQQHMDTAARLFKELQKLYPADLQQLFEGPDSATFAAAVLHAWALDVNSFEEQQAAVSKREEDVLMEKRGVQQLIVSVAGMTKHAQLMLDNRAYSGVSEQAIPSVRDSVSDGGSTLAACVAVVTTGVVVVITRFTMIAAVLMHPRRLYGVLE